MKNHYELLWRQWRIIMNYYEDNGELLWIIMKIKNNEELWWIIMKIKNDGELWWIIMKWYELLWKQWRMIMNYNERMCVIANFYEF
jgi:hypothetical protein